MDAKEVVIVRNSHTVRYCPGKETPHARALADSSQLHSASCDSSAQIMPAKDISQVQLAIQKSVDRLISIASGDFARSTGRPVFKVITDGLLINIQQAEAQSRPLSKLAQKRLIGVGAGRFVAFAVSFERSLEVLLNGFNTFFPWCSWCGTLHAHQDRCRPG